MNFLIDAQLPISLARSMSAAGHNCVHTSELPEGNRTTDTVIAELADREVRVVVTKDRDFRDSHLLRGRPARLLLVTTGNCSNAELLALFQTNLTAIEQALNDSEFVELHADRLVTHRRN